MWPPSSATRHHLNYNLSPELGVVGLRDLFLVAPASSFHHHHQSNEPSLISSDPHSNTALNSSNAAATALGVGVGVFPLLTAPCLGQPGLDDSDKNNCNPDRHNNNLGASIHPFWQNQNQNQNHHHQQQTHQQQNHNNFHKKTMMFDHADSSSNLLNSSSINGGGNGGGGGASAPMTSSATTTLACQDCGNQAKKDCCHRRCRTCCKNRGYDCSTHVKSTWVPAARRRERQLMSGPNGGVSSGSTSGVKKPRLVGGASQTTTTSHTSNSNNTPPRSFETSSSHQDASFKETLPGQVRAPAVFRCVRVTALEEGEDEYAYQAIVKIGGHVFKGFLYDQGSQGRDDHGYPNLSELHLGGGGGLGRNNGVSSSTPMLDAAVDVFASAGALLGGGSAAYGNQMN